MDLVNLVDYKGLDSHLAQRVMSDRKLYFGAMAEAKKSSILPAWTERLMVSRLGTTFRGLISASSGE